MPLCVFRERGAFTENLAGRKLPLHAVRKKCFSNNAEQSYVFCKVAVTSSTSLDCVYWAQQMVVSWLLRAALEAFVSALRERRVFRGQNVVWQRMDNLFRSLFLLVWFVVSVDRQEVSSILNYG